MKRDNGIINKVGISYPYFFNFILKLEKRAFGWHYDGWSKERQYVDSTIHDSGRITHNFRIVRYCFFSRPDCYVRGFFMMLFELLSKLASWLRRILMGFLPIVAIACVLLYLFTKQDVFWIAPVAVYGGVIGASLFFALMGFVCRKIWKSDEKTDMLNDEAGYLRWSETEEGHYFDPDM